MFKIPICQQIDFDLRCVLSAAFCRAIEIFQNEN